jgi:hypothetical protein
VNGRPGKDESRGFFCYEGYVWRSGCEVRRRKKGGERREERGEGGEKRRGRKEERRGERREGRGYLVVGSEEEGRPGARFVGIV